MPPLFTRNITLIYDKGPPAIVYRLFPKFFSGFVFIFPPLRHYVKSIELINLKMPRGSLQRLLNTCIVYPPRYILKHIIMTRTNGMSLYCLRRSIWSIWSKRCFFGRNDACQRDILKNAVTNNFPKIRCKIMSKNWFSKPFDFRPPDIKVR